MVKLAPKDPDAIAMQLTNYADMTDEERDFAEQLGPRGQVIVRDRQQPVSGLGRYMPTKAAEEIQAAIPYVFSVYHFTEAWKRKKIRPPAGDAHPSKTNSDFCEYDAPTKTYRYTKPWIQHLIKKCSTADGFTAMTGTEPRLKPTTSSSV